MTALLSKKSIILSAVFILMNCMIQHANCAVQQIELNSEADSLPISVLISTPDKGIKIKGVVQIVHGMCEYKERYTPFTQFLNKNGYVTVIHDHRGHGASVLNSEDLGYFYDAGYIAMIEDARMVGQYVQKQYSDLPFFLLGHSMGSMVVRSYTKRYDDMLYGLVVCGSPSYNSSSKIGMQMAKREMKRNGDKTRPEWMQKMAFGSFNKKFKDEGSPNAWICSDPEVVLAYDNDPLCNYQFTANGFYNLFAIMQDAYSLSDWAMNNPHMPILFIAGEDDPCIINKRKFKDAQNRMRKVGYIHIDSKLYPTMRHEILNETGKEQVWNDILRFFNGLIPAK